MKTKLFSLFLMLMISVGTIFASTIQVGGIWYDFNSSSLTATVTYRGYSYSEYSNEYSGTVTIPSYVKYSGKAYRVTSIGTYAFYGCNSLTSVTIPNGVTNIGTYAFYGCSSLPSVTIPNSVTKIGSYAFHGCTGLTSVEIPDSVTIIEERTFHGCTGLTSVTIPNSVTSIGSSAFYGCSSLTSLTIPNRVTSIGNDAFYGCSSLPSVTIPNGVTKIGSYAFYGCSSLTSVVIPNGVTSIENSTFYGCTGLTSVTIPNSVTSIGNEAFFDCTILTSVTIPNGVTNIGKKAFQNCTGLRSATIPNRVTNIEERTFAGCTSLTSVTIPNSVTNIGKEAFQNCTGLTSVTIDANVICSKNYSYSGSGIRSIFGDQVKKYNIGNSVTGIGNFAFCGCKSLTSVTIGNGVTSIGTYAFGDCTGLTSLKIPNSVTSIGDHAFSYVNNIVYSGTATGAPWGAKSLNGYVDGYLVYRDNSKTELLGCSTAAIGEMTIPNSVTSVGSSAFYGCTGLTSVHISDITSWCAINFLNNYSNPLRFAHNLYLNGDLVTDLVIPAGVTNIRNYAFQDCTGLTSVTIPNCVTSIGNSAFSGCTGLNSVTIDANAICSKNYSTSSGIRSIFGNQVKEYIIGNSVTGIGDYAFYGCSSLTSVTIPNSVTSVGSSAFYGCTGLTSVHISDIASWCAINFLNDYSNPLRFAHNLYENGKLITELFIPVGVTNIRNQAFYGCSSLTSVVIPNSVTRIGEAAFYDCTGLTSVHISDIASWCAINFLNDYSNPLHLAHKLYVNGTLITNLSIPDTVKSIGNYAFYTCNGLTSVTIPQSVTNIGSSAFYGCTGLSSVHMSDIASWCAINFLNNYSNPLYYAHNLYKNGTRITDLVIPTGVINIRNQAFNGCTSLTSVTIPNSVTSIGSEAFNCANLSVIRVDTVVPPALGTNGFGSSSYKSIYVPCGSLNAYKSSWSSYMSSIKYEPITYNIVIETPKHGQVTAPQNICESLLIATPDNGYHFVQWSDGNTENPRTIVLTQDTTFAVEFGINKYSIDVTCDDQYGMIVGESGSYDYHSQIVYEAVPRYGYHFEKWSDGNKENPRSILVNDDLSITAIFAKNTYSIYSPYTQEQGTVSGAGVYQYLDTISLAANAKYGYHFVQWNDGNKENPRIIVLTQDTTITAEFAKNTYTITTESDNPEWGMANGGKSALYLDKVEISATAYYGYHFAKWNDGNTQNPRTVTVTEDKNYTATFAKNTYRITKIAEQGTILGPSQAQYLETVTLTANPNYGYHFAQWSDGETVNPRDFVLTQDTTFTAEFAIAKSGTCGENMALNWAFDDSTKTLTISGLGALTENYTFGLEAPTQMEHIIIGNDVTAIGDRAFYGKTTIAQVTIGGNVTSIGNYAFANIDNRQLTSIVMPAELSAIGDYAFSGNTYLEHIDFNAKLLSIGAYAFKDCRRVSEMTCMAETTPDVGTNALSSINSYASLCVPASCVRKYQVDPNWGRFDLCELGATTSTGSVTTVTVEPSDNTALFTWPTENEAATYTLQITKDGEVFCTLVFNANGQLTGIAFAPSRTGTPHAPAATLSNGAMQFTVTGLNVANKYAYRLAVTDASNVEIISYRGEFATNGYENVDQLHQDPASNTHKFLRNGQILIQRGDRTYTVTGQELK